MELDKMKNMQKRICVITNILLVAILILTLCFYHHRNKSFLNQDSVKNEVFTEEFFEGLIQVQSVTNSSSISKRDDLKELCNILANLSLRESDYESDMNHYGGYFFVLKFEHGKEKKLSFMGVSESRTLIYVDKECYETEEAILPRIIEFLKKKT